MLADAAWKLFYVMRGWERVPVASKQDWEAAVGRSRGGREYLLELKQNLAEKDFKGLCVFTCTAFNGAPTLREWAQTNGLEL